MIEMKLKNKYGKTQEMQLKQQREILNIKFKTFTIC